MPFTINAAAGHFLGSGGANPLTISVSPGQLIAVACFSNFSSGATAGSLADSGGNVYTPGNALTSNFGSDQQDTFYCLSATNAVTTITFTPAAGGDLSVIAAWVLTPT